jgi:hypothetical protein
MNLDWIKTIPEYISYFNDDHRLIIELVGIDNYLKLYIYFCKTGLHFPGGQYVKERGINDRQYAIELIGEHNYNKLLGYFGRGGVYFSSSPVTRLKKTWAIINKDVDYYQAARTLDVSIKSIFNWRQEGCTN